VATLKFLAVAALVGYVAVTVLVWLAQEKLLFYPQLQHGRPVAPPGWELQDVRIAMRDGTRLAGVLVRPSQARGPLVIYFGGNAEEVTAYASAAAGSYGARAVLMVNYRGYGESEGRPGERSMVADGIEIFDWAAARGDVDPARIALHGRSLGTGVAVQVAAARPVRCLILTSPFTSALEVARSIYGWLPVALLMRHPFDSMAHAPRLGMPALFLMGDADTLIPMRLSQRLADAWGGPVERETLPGFGHNDLSMHPRYDAAVQAFLGRHL
jgi:uncharacterized protein